MLAESPGWGMSALVVNTSGRPSGAHSSLIATSKLYGVSCERLRAVDSEVKSAWPKSSPAKADVAELPSVRGDVGVGRAVRRAEDPSLVAAVDPHAPDRVVLRLWMKRSKTIRFPSGVNEGWLAQHDDRGVRSVTSLPSAFMSSMLEVVSSSRARRRSLGLPATSPGKRASPSTWVI